MGSIGSVSNVGSPGSKPFFFLNFNTLPRRIPQHHIEPSRPASLLILWLLTFSQHPEHIRESQVPVEELVLFSQLNNLILHPRCDVERVSLNIAEDFFGDGVSELIVLLPHEGGTPGVGPQPARLVSVGLDQLIIVVLLAA